MSNCTQSFASIDMAPDERIRRCERLSVLVQRLRHDLERLACSDLLICFYISMRCNRCGGIREALSELPSADSIPCPHCERPCNYYPLAAGLTSRPLPFFESLRTIRKDQLTRMPWCGSLWHGLKQIRIAPEPILTRREAAELEMKPIPGGR